MFTLINSSEVSKQIKGNLISLSLLRNKILRNTNVRVESDVSITSLVFVFQQ